MSLFSFNADSLAWRMKLGQKIEDPVKKSFKQQFNHPAQFILTQVIKAGQVVVFMSERVILLQLLMLYLQY